MQCQPVDRGRNNKSITRNAPESPFSEDQLSGATSAAVSTLDDVLSSPTPTPRQVVGLYKEPLVRSPSSDWDNLRNTSCSPRPRMNCEQDNPPNHHGPDRSDCIGNATWILCSMVFPPSLGTEVVDVEAYISSFHPGSQVVLKLTPRTISKLAQAHRLNYSGYPTTSGNN